VNYPALTAPLRLGPVTLANRIVSAPMERNYCTTDGVVTDAYVAYLTARAAGGAALVFSEACYVRADGKGRVRQMGVDEDRHMSGITDLAGAVHRHGAKLGVELNHGGRTAQRRVSGLWPVAPSAVPCPPAGGDMPRALGREEIHDLVECYGAAARRCREAGVDVLSVHAAHGYLIHQFLSPLTNRRMDEFAAPTRFLDLVLQAVRRGAPDLCVGIRVSALEGVPGGLDNERSLELIRSTRLDLIDFIDVSAGNYEAAQWMVQPGEWRPGVLAPYAVRYRGLGLPVGVAGRISDPETAEALLVDRQADFVSLARALHADPNWPRSVATGSSYRPCIACNLCIDSLHSGDPVPCSVNQDVGGTVDRPVRPTSRRGATGVGVLVVGAGPAGLETARLMARHGHSVHLVEREAQIGGQFRLAAALHGNPDFHKLLSWYARELAELGVVTRTRTEADATIVAELRPEAVVVATGGHGYISDVAGADLPHVIDIRDWLRRGEATPAHCTVWGTDRAAMAVADHIAVHGGEVLIVGAQPRLAPEVGPRARMLQAGRLEDNPKVRIRLNSRVRLIRPDHLVVDGPGGDMAIPTYGPILISHGVQAEARLATRFRTAAPGLPVHLAGLAAGVGNSMHDALQSATAVATGLLNMTR
jgi:2,4-dienoyl-CoA reductase-like NADH-dependent reductase (Old Yellow Enzyme family)